MNFLCDSAPVCLTEGIAGRILPGPGEKVFWIHGYTLNSRSWGGMWSRMPEWHHIGADFPGHGASEPISRTLDLEKLGKLLGDYCLTEGVRHIVGLSFGTVAALQIALEYPSEFASFTLAAPAIAGGPQDLSVQSAYSELFMNYQRGMRGSELRERWMACDAWHGVDTVAGLQESLGTLVDSHQWNELAEFSIRRVFEPVQTNSDFGRITTPVLILIGDNEMPAFVSCADTLESTLPNCKRAVLHETSHLCLLQSPDQAAPLLAQHLNANRGVSS